MLRKCYQLPIHEVPKSSSKESGSLWVSTMAPSARHFRSRHGASTTAVWCPVWCSILRIRLWMTSITQMRPTTTIEILWVLVHLVALRSSHWSLLVAVRQIGIGPASPPIWSSCARGSAIYTGKMNSGAQYPCWSYQMCSTMHHWNWQKNLWQSLQRFLWPEKGGPRAPETSFLLHTLAKVPELRGNPLERNVSSYNTSSLKAVAVPADVSTAQLSWDHTTLRKSFFNVHR